MGESWKDIHRDIVAQLFTPQGIQPYQFEPLVTDKPADIHAYDTSSDESDLSSDQDSDIDDDPEVERLINTHWCECGTCISMDTVKECVCCREFKEIDKVVDNANLEGLIVHPGTDLECSCITEHPGFIANCLNRYVIEVAMYEYAEDVGPFDDNIPINERYQFLAKRRFILWIWHKLRRYYEKKTLPACVVDKIRKAFLPQKDCDFTYVDL